MRVERAFAFIDLSGFTGYTHRNGDGAAREILTEFRSIVRDAVDQHGIRVAKWLGDGAMLVSVNLELLASAVVAIHERMRATQGTLPIRSGIAVGAVIVFEGDDYIGTTVNLAARLCDQAANDEILAHGIVAGRLTGAAICNSLGLRTIPGIAETVEVVQLVALTKPLQPRSTSKPSPHSGLVNVSDAN